MDRLREICRRLGSVFRRRRMARDLEEEMRFHLEMKARENVEVGLSEEEALWAARRAFGNRALAMEDSRAAWQFHFLEIFLQDIRYALRTLARNSVFTGAVVLTLALGIGANTAMFTLVESVMLRRLPVEEPERLYVLGNRNSMGTLDTERPEERDTSFFSFPLFREFRKHTWVFSDLTAISSFPVNAYVGSDLTASGASPEKAEARLVTGSFFSVLGVRAFLGRTLTPEDDETPGAHPVAVLSHGYWSKRFGRDPTVVGRRLHINGIEYTIVGITPAGFSGVTVGRTTDVWVPMMMQAQLMRGPSYLDDRNTMWLRIIGRLRPEVTAAQADTESNDLFHRFLMEEAGTDLTLEVKNAISRKELQLTGFAKGFGGVRERLSRPLTLLMGLVGLVLLIACANVGNLLLARASGRKREVALRLALGSARGRLLRQLLTESMALALFGGAIGLLLARWTVGLLLPLLSSQATPLHLEVRVDERVLAFTLLVSILTALLFGLAPALRATRVDLIASLKTQGAAAQAKHERWSLRQTLVVSQVAISLVLLIAAGLFLRSLQNLNNQDPGFHPEGVLLVVIDPQGGGYTEEQLPHLYEQWVQRVEAIPRVRSASLSFFSLFYGTRWISRASIDGHTRRTDEDDHIEATMVTPHYFQTVGAPVILGRGLEPRDREGSSKVAVVNETFARRFFGDESPLGKRFGIEGEDSSRDVEIVGVVRDLTYHHFREDTPPLVYFPVAQMVDYLNSLEVRVSGEPTALAPQVRQVLTDVAGNLPILEVKTLTEQIDRSLRNDKLISLVTSIFGMLALLLASVGLYGVLAYGVAQRTNEIGIRVALGARRLQVMWMVLRDATALVGIGVAIGIPAALATAGLASSLLFGLEATDPATILGAAIVLSLVAVVAGYLPARRAARLDPVRALRYE